jgi:hypothetical protein
LKHYVVELEDHLSEAQRQSMKLVKRQRELGQVLSDFGKSVKLLGNCEGGSLGKAFADLGGCADQLSFKLQNKVRFSNNYILLQVVAVIADISPGVCNDCTTCPLWWIVVIYDSHCRQQEG